MFLKFDCSCSSLFFFVKGRVNSFLFEQKLRKMNMHLLGKNFDVFTQNSTFFIQILKIIKNRCHSKTIPGHVVFQLLLESTFSLKLFLLLNNSLDASGCYFI